MRPGIIIMLEENYVNGPLNLCVIFVGAFDGAIGAK